MTFDQELEKIIEIENNKLLDSMSIKSYNQWLDDTLKFYIQDDELKSPTILPNHITLLKHFCGRLYDYIKNQEKQIDDLKSRIEHLENPNM